MHIHACVHIYAYVICIYAYVICIYAYVIDISNDVHGEKGDVDEENKSEDMNREEVWKVRISFLTFHNNNLYILRDS